MSKKVEFASEEELRALEAADELTANNALIKAESAREINEACGKIHRATSDFKEMINNSLLTFRSGDVITDSYIIRILLERGAPIAFADGASYTTCPCPCKHTFAVR